MAAIEVSKSNGKNKANASQSGQVKRRKVAKKTPTDSVPILIETGKIDAST